MIALESDKMIELESGWYVAADGWIVHRDRNEEWTHGVLYTGKICRRCNIPIPDKVLFISKLIRL